MTDYVSPLDSKKPLLKEEDFIQFDMPIDILPSFKGPQRTYSVQFGDKN